MPLVEFIVPRDSTTETTTAIVQARVQENLEDKSRFLTALRRAVSEWMVTSEEGQREWSYSSADFNIGDLASLPLGDHPVIL